MLVSRGSSFVLRCFKPQPKQKEQHIVKRQQGEFLERCALIQPVVLICLTQVDFYSNYYKGTTFYLPPRPDRLRGPLNHIYTEYRGSFRGAKVG